MLIPDSTNSGRLGEVILTQLSLKLTSCVLQLFHSTLFLKAAWECLGLRQPADGQRERQRRRWVEVAQIVRKGAINESTHGNSPWVPSQLSLKQSTQIYHTVNVNSISIASIRHGCIKTDMLSSWCWYKWIPIVVSSTCNWYLLWSPPFRTSKMSRREVKYKLITLVGNTQRF